MLDPTFDDIELKISLKDFLQCFNNPRHFEDDEHYDKKVNFWIVPHNDKDFVVYEWWKDNKLYVQAKHGSGSFVQKRVSKCKATNDDKIDIDDLQAQFDNIDIKDTLSDTKAQEALKRDISKSPYKKFIKYIDLDKEMKFEDFSLASAFIHVADIVQDDSERKTVIKFAPMIPLDQWQPKNEWVYIFLIDERIVKIGGTRNGLGGRTGSYLCGHHTSERGGNDKCSVTNAYIYNTFDFYLKHGYNIKMMGYRIPPLHVSTNVFGKNVMIIAQTFHTYESVALEKYRQENGTFPFLSNNADPDYRSGIE